MEETTDIIPYPILVVDDEENIRRSLLRLLTREGYNGIDAASGAEGLKILQRVQDVAVIISDHRMPEMTGVEFLEKAREIAPDAVRIMLTGYSSKDAAVDSINRGGAHFYLEKPWKDVDLLGIIFNSLQRFSMIRENRVLQEIVKNQNTELQAWNANLEKRVTEQTQRLERNFQQTLVVFANLLELREGDEASHSRDTASLARFLCELHKVGLAETASIVIAARLHDIGKIGLPDTIARKTVDLMNPTEFVKYKEHAILGQSALNAVEDLQEAATLVRHHHERWDGSGFPDRLRWDAIPVGARIIALADYLDHGIRGMSSQSSREELARNAHLRMGRQFDPALTEHVEPVVNAFFKSRVVASKATDVEVQIKDLRTGMILSRDLRSGTGFLLLSGGTALNTQHIDAIWRYYRTDPFRRGIFVMPYKERAESEHKE